MKTYRVIRAVLWFSAAVLSDVMCAVVAYNYCALQWGGRYAAYSAPACTAFLYLIPYGAGIAVCVVLALFFGRKAEDGKDGRQSNRA